MKLLLVLTVTVISLANLSLNEAFHFPIKTIGSLHQNIGVSSVGTRMSMSGGDSNYDLVPVTKVNTENASAITGGILGIILGGPIFRMLLAAISNYVAKKDNEAG